MKKSICLALVIVILTALCSCSLIDDMKAAFSGDAESAKKVTEMMTALCEGRSDDASALLHPEAADGADNDIENMINYIGGRQVVDMKLSGYHINAYASVSGSTKEEEYVYRLEMSDGEILHVNAVYRSNNNGVGFSSFRFIHGVA
jgi:hypothetical protein